MGATEANEGRASKTRTTFRMEYAVAIRVQAPPARIWPLLTDVPRMPEWNRTIERAEGTVEPGGRVKLRVTIAPDREFSLRVDEVVPERRIVWSDGFRPIFRGVRRYELTPMDDGATLFEMAEVFTGMMLPMIAGSLPDFRESFEHYAADLKRAAEGGRQEG